MKALHLESLRQDFSHWARTNLDPWEFAAFAGFIVAGMAALWVLHRIVGTRIRAWTRQHDPVLGERIVAALAAPLRVLVLAYFFILGFDHFSEMPHSVWQNVHDLVPLVYGLSAFLFAFRSMDIVTELLRRRWAGDNTSLDERWARLIGGVGKVLVFAVAVMMFLGPSKMLPLLTGMSVFGAAVALALQSTVGNAIGSMEIMVGKLFKEGDRIAFQDYDGFVTGMGLRSIQLTSMTGEKISLPNKDVVDRQIRNYSKAGKVRTVFVVGLAYGHTRAEVEKALALLQSIVEAHEKASEPSVIFKGFGSSTLDLQVAFWGDYTDGSGYSALVSALNLAIKEKFDAAGLEFAFPSTTVYLRPDGRPAIPAGS